MAHLINIWYEAKAGGFWAELVKSEKALSKFRSKIIQKLRIAQDNGKIFKIYTNSAIPEFLKEWFNEKGIVFHELF